MVLGLKEGLVECATVCIKSVIILLFALDTCGWLKLVDIAAAVVRKITKSLSLAFLCNGHAWLKATSAYFSYKLKCRSEATPENYKELV